MIMFIDGERVDVVEWHPCADNSGWIRVLVKPAGAPGGPHAEHKVPQLRGAFRTGGHDYRFEAKP
jgi:hypothetical protein